MSCPLIVLAQFVGSFPSGDKDEHLIWSSYPSRTVWLEAGVTYRLHSKKTFSIMNKYFDLFCFINYRNIICFHHTCKWKPVLIKQDICFIRYQTGLQHLHLWGFSLFLNDGILLTLSLTHTLTANASNSSNWHYLNVFKMCSNLPPILVTCQFGPPHELILSNHMTKENGVNMSPLGNIPR